MEFLNLSAILISLAALFSYINHRFFRLPAAIGIMLAALLFSLLLTGIDLLGLPIKDNATQLLQRINFNTTVLQGMLGFLLFAGALHVNLDDLSQQKWAIASMATFGVVLCTFLVGTFVWYALGWIDLQLPYIYCLLFGALISPTDPIAVLGILKTAGAPKSLETKITGESLFNDGIGVVVFLALLGIASGKSEISAGSIGLLFVEEVVGGTILGFFLGWLGFHLLKSVNQYQVEVLLTLALVMGGYALAYSIHVSGPIAVVITGLMIGNKGRMLAMSDKTREHLDTFWELLDEILNAALFVLIGLEVLVITLTGNALLAGALAIPLVLLARFISTGVPITALRQSHNFTPNSIKIMTWAGLRGGISIALALSLPLGPERELILVMTYVVVIFSILVQGLTIEKILKRWVPEVKFKA